MEEVLQEMIKHMCKFCNKSFPCGRSLGGHMRSHVVNSAENHQRPKKKKKLSPANNGEIVADEAGTPSYSLRENPKKKTHKFDDSNEEDWPHDKLCRECGRGFQSWKALFGHMKCHSEKFSDSFEQQDSWASANQKPVYESNLDNETSANRSNKKTKKKKKRSKRGKPRYLAIDSNCSSSVFSEIEQEQEEVAMCLMMLSRDVGVGSFTGLNSVDESSDNNFELLEAGSSIRSSRITDKTESNCGETVKYSTKIEAEKLDCGFSINEHKLKNPCSGNAKLLEPQAELVKKSGEFECTTCNKAFHSYQALGGHRASHKKIKGCFNNSTETEVSPNNFGDEQIELKMVVAKKEKNKKEHECPICFKIFLSGQALGGHKRSHLIEPKINNHTNNQSSVVVVQKPIREIRELLDLNLPASVEEEIRPWWVGSNHNHEHILGLI